MKTAGDRHNMKIEMPRLTWSGNPSESAGLSEVRVLTNNSPQVPENQPRQLLALPTLQRSYPLSRGLAYSNVSGKRSLTLLSSSGGLLSQHEGGEARRFT